MNSKNEILEIRNIHGNLVHVLFSHGNTMYITKSALILVYTAFHEGHMCKWNKQKIGMN